MTPQLRGLCFLSWTCLDRDIWIWYQYGDRSYMLISELLECLPAGQ
jgi:hypothetical protein